MNRKYTLINRYLQQSRKRVKFNNSHIEINNKLKYCPDCNSELYFDKVTKKYICENPTCYFSADSNGNEIVDLDLTNIVSNR